MAMAYTSQEYGSSKGILVFPDHYVAVGIKHAKGTSGTPGLSVLVDGHYIVKAGTIYPSNDASAIGVVLNDVDVTYGDEMMAVVLHGFISKAKLPVAVAAAAIAVLPDIHFLPVVPYATVALTGTLKAIAVDATAVYAVTVGIANATFREEAETIGNWTITGEVTAAVVLSAPTLSADMRSITFTLTATSANAGSITIRPAASCVSLGVQPAAYTIATVA